MIVELINYDNGSRQPVLPQNLYHLQKVLRISGHNAHVNDFNLSKHPYSTISSNKIYHPDVYGLGFISGYWPHQEAIKIAKEINSHPARKHFKFVLGGHGPSAAPEYYLRKLGADAVFTGSADVSLPHWLDNGMPDGIIHSDGYWLADQRIHGDDAKLAIYKRVRFPTTKENEFAIQILSGRGCPYSCAFCYRMGEGYQRYVTDRLILDIAWYANRHNITHFQFSDELLMNSVSDMIDLSIKLLALQDTIGKKLYFDCNGRLNVAARKVALDMFAIMKKAGFRYINYGCESLSNDVLLAIGKKQTVDEIYRGVKNTIDAGLHPGLNFMWGNPGDNLQSLSDAKNFIIAHNTGCELRTIRPVTPYPGTELFKRLEITVDEFYEQHTNSDLFSFHFMDGMSSRQANVELASANYEIVEDFEEWSAEANLVRMVEFYNGNLDPTSFRGFREV